MNPASVLTARLVHSFWIQGVLIQSGIHGFINMWQGVRYSFQNRDYAQRVPQYQRCSQHFMLFAFQWELTLVRWSIQRNCPSFYQKYDDDTGITWEKSGAQNSSVDLKFTCKLRRFTCQALEKDGNPCYASRRGGVPLCWQHTLSEFGVKISDQVSLRGTEIPLPF